MLDLQDREWKDIFIGNNFDVKRPKSRSEKQYQDGNVPFIASGNINNGVIRCCSPDFNEQLDKGNCITVSPVDGSAFYQEFDFLGRGGAGSSILLLYNNNLNRYSGLFIARMIRQTCSKYCYGKMGSQESIKREKIMLPVDEKGNIDYAFMEQYIKERESQLIQKYKKYIEQNSYGWEQRNLSSVKWGEFFIAGNDVVFTIRSTKSGIDKNKLLYDDDRDTPYITRSEVNNGINMFISKKQSDRYTIDKGNVITIGLDTQTVFYQPYSFYTGQNIQVLEYPNMNKYSALFICNMLKVQMNKFNWGGNGATLGRLNRTKIMLPIDETGNPDYSFMEQYTRNIIQKKYRDYINYISR